MIAYYLSDNGTIRCYKAPKLVQLLTVFTILIIKLILFSVASIASILGLLPLYRPTGLCWITVLSIGTKMGSVAPVLKKLQYFKLQHR